MRATTGSTLLATLVLLAGLAGCGGGDSSGNPGSAPASSHAARSTPANPSSSGTPVATVPPFPTGTRPSDGGRGSGNGLGLTGVRTAHHPGYDRVVFDLDGRGTPGWRVHYTAHPVYEGSGDPVTLQGTVFLSVVLRGMGLPYDTGIPPYGDDTTRVPGSGAEGVTEIAPGGVFEGEQQAYIGLTGAERPFRVFTRSDPTRVIVDVRDH